MNRRGILRSSCAMAAAIGLLQPVGPVLAQSAGGVTVGPPSSPIVQGYVRAISQEPRLSHADKLKLLQQNIKYVFVLFQENRAFDFYFGTFPGASGLFSQPKSATAGFTQPIVDTDGSVGTISPFLIPQTVSDPSGNPVPLYPMDTASIDHSHTGMNNSLDFNASYVAANDRYALDEEGLTTSNGAIVSTSTKQAPTSNPTLAQKQMGELAVSHVDCDTVPFLWQYADRFAMFDNFHQTTIGPSTPNAISMIAGQTGQTQWVLHPEEASNNTENAAVKTSGGEPIVSDVGPFPGSNLDTVAVKPPYNPGDENPATPGLNQTYATLPLSFMGNQINQTIQSDENPALDLVDVQGDIRTIAGGLAPTNWGWYQEGYDQEPTDTGGTASHSSYIIHHNGPQYFGYIGDNTQEQNNLHGLNDFFNAISKQSLPSSGVFYVRGGYQNIAGLKPVDPNPAVQSAFPGDDDHPGYSDAQISEALIAREVSAIANSPYWKNSAIIITYDETDGLYDNGASRVRALDPEGNPLNAGPRIPAIIISPYAKAHAIVHRYNEHNSVIKFIDELYNLTPLADLPDEARARTLGQQELGQSNLGPADAKVPDIGDLFGAFDNARLTGAADPLPASYAAIDPNTINSLPHYGSAGGCYTLNIVPTDYQGGKLIDPPPADFNPRPSTTPGIPTSGTWTP